MSLKVNQTPFIAVKENPEQRITMLGAIDWCADYMSNGGKDVLRGQPVGLISSAIGSYLTIDYLIGRARNL